MKRMSKLLAILLTLTLVFSFVGCSPADDPEPEPVETEEPANGEEEEPAEEFEISSIAIGTASVGGALYAFGGGFVNVWNELGISASAEVTGGSIHNTNLVEAGEIMSALISQGAAWESTQGIGLFEGETPTENLRTALPLHASFIHGWTLDDSVQTYADLDGLVVCGGPAGGTSDLWSKQIAELIGIQPSQFVNTAFADAPNMLRDGMVDVFVASMGVPASATAESASTLGARIIGVSPEEAEIVLEGMPFLAQMSIPAGTYDGQDEDVDTVGDVNAYYFHKDVPEDVVYAFVAAAYENIEELKQAFAGAERMTYEHVQDLRMPLHPGAYRYYEENGVDVPDDAMPID